MAGDNFRKLLISELQDIYNAENQIIRALPKMAKAAQNEELKAAFLGHLDETKNQLRRLEQVFHLLTEPAKGKLCPAMKGLLEESAAAIEGGDPSPLRDAQLIGAAQLIEHHEMAAYGTVRAFAEKLGKDKIVRVLEQTLTEVSAADKMLTKLGEKVNSGALSFAEPK